MKKNAYEISHIDSTIYMTKKFYNAAFTGEEKGIIQTSQLKNEDNLDYGTEGGKDTNDKVFLLSLDEAESYFPSNEARQRKPTAYAVKQGAYNNGNCWWWLRSPGYESSLAADVNPVGSLDFYGGWVRNGYYAVLPSLRINPFMGSFP